MNFADEDTKMGKAFSFSEDKNFYTLSKSSITKSSQSKAEKPKLVTAPNLVTSPKQNEI